KPIASRQPPSFFRFRDREHTFKRRRSLRVFSQAVVRKPQAQDRLSRRRSSGMLKRKALIKLNGQIKSIRRHRTFGRKIENGCRAFPFQSFKSPARKRESVLPLAPAIKRARPCHQTIGVSPRHFLDHSRARALKL